LVRAIIEMIARKNLSLIPTPCATGLNGSGPPHYRGFTITLRHTTIRRSPLDEGSARRRDLYLTTHNIHNNKKSMPPTGFKHAIPTSEWQQTHVLDRTATGIGVETEVLGEKENPVPLPRFHYKSHVECPGIEQVPVFEKSAADKPEP
jgi:hypothetical protein